MKFYRASDFPELPENYRWYRDVDFADRPIIVLQKRPNRFFGWTTVSWAPAEHSEINAARYLIEGENCKNEIYKMIGPVE